MNRTKRLLALLLAGYMGSAVAAGPSYLGNLSGQTVGIANTYYISSSLFPSGSTFADIYSFDISPVSVAVGTSVTINLDLPFLSGPEFELSNMMIQFADAFGTLIVADAQSDAADTTLSVAATLPMANDYKFIVSGKVTGTLGGSYGGVLQAISVAYPVPEADTYALMGLGLGLVGLLARRRKA